MEFLMQTLPSSRFSPRRLVISLCVAISVIGCTDAQRAKVGGLGDEFKIEMYSGGVLVKEWTSTGKVSNEENSDGYYFRDKETGKLIEVSADVVITKL